MEEDPEKVAARKAFLLSSVPESLKKSQVFLQNHDGTQGKEEEDETWLTPFAPSSSICHHVTQISELPRRPPQQGLKLRQVSNGGGQQMFTTITAGLLESSAPSKAKGLNEQGYLMGQKIQRLEAPQIYQHFLNMKRDKTAEVTTKIFGRYLERKIEADTLEQEARSKNVSLNEIEEERNKGGAQRRRLKKKRKTKVTKAHSGLALGGNYF